MDMQELELLDNIDTVGNGENVLCTNAIKLYLRNIGQFKLLTQEEENSLTQKIANGDNVAKSKLINSNLRLVVFIAKRYMRRGLPLIDLIQEGNIGLMKAVDKFDYTKGYKFSTYASYWIKQSITRAIGAQVKTIRIPTYIIEQISKVKKIEQELLQKNNCIPTYTEIAIKMGTSEKDIQKLYSYIVDVSSLDVSIGDEEDTTLGSLVEDENAISPVENVISSDFLSSLHEVLTSLNEREADVICKRFGINESRPMTLEEIGKIYGVTRECIRQIETKAMRKLRHPMRANILKEFL